MSELNHAACERVIQNGIRGAQLFPVRLGCFQLTGIDLVCPSCSARMDFSESPAQRLEQGPDHFSCEAVGFCCCGLRYAHVTYASEGDQLSMQACHHDGTRTTTVYEASNGRRIGPSLARRVFWLGIEGLVMAFVAVSLALSLAFLLFCEGVMALAETLSEPLRAYTGASHEQAVMLMFATVVCLYWALYQWLFP